LIETSHSYSRILNDFIDVICVSDFLDNFDTLEIVNLGPEDLEHNLKVEGVKWNTSYFEGAWTPGK